MINRKIRDYVLYTPGNTNRTILDDLLASHDTDIKNFYEKSNVTKINDYFYSIDFYNWDLNLGAEFIDEQGAWACSSVRNGNIFGRNYDWYYDQRVSYLVKCHGDGKRLSSIGMASGVGALNATNDNLLSYTDLYELLPSMTLDGINEAGVVCNLNVTATGDKGLTTGTNPKKPKLHMISMVRYILDYAHSADEAIALLKERNLVASLNGAPQEFHLMVADSSVTYVVEFVNNKMVVINDFVDDKPIMTNFYLDGFDGTKASLTPFGAGFERYQILADAYDNITDVATGLTAMSNVKYTRAYDTTVDPQWYSEFVGDYTKSGHGILTNASDPADFAEVMEIARQRYEEDDRKGKSWQTVHTAVYDLSTKTMKVVTQEDYEHSYEFSIDWN